MLGTFKNLGHRFGDCLSNSETEHSDGASSRPSVPEAAPYTTDSIASASLSPSEASYSSAANRSEQSRLGELLNQKDTVMTSKDIGDYLREASRWARFHQITIPQLHDKLRKRSLSQPNEKDRLQSLQLLVEKAPNKASLVKLAETRHHFMSLDDYQGAIITVVHQAEERGWAKHPSFDKLTREWRKREDWEDCQVREKWKPLPCQPRIEGDLPRNNA